MNYIDFHCDTIGECFLQQKHLYSNDLHISLQKAAEFKKYAQVFAVWIPDEKRGNKAFEYFNGVYNNFLSELRKNSGYIELCKTGNDIESAFKNGRTAAILSVEGGAALAGKIENLEYLYDCGVRLITLTWNGKNELGDGCFCENAGGLTVFGKTVVREMQKRNMLVDVSHLSEKGFYDVAEISEKPFVASHSNLRIVKNKWGTVRNLSQEQAKVIIDRKGIIGLNFCGDFLGDDGDNGREALLRHIYRFLELGAENCLAFGCDFDGCNVNPELDGLTSIIPLYDWLLGKNLPQKTLNNIFFDNAYRFLIANI